MEVSGFGCFSSCATSSSRPSLWAVGDSNGVFLRPRKAPLNRVLESCLEYRDNGHRQYYYNNIQGGSVRCGGNKKEKQQSSIKKKLKLVKSLSKNMSMFSNDNALLHQPQANSLQEAAQVLMNQLQELRAKEKELKRQKKEEKKAKLKMMDSESSSSSSSESSDSEDGEVVNMSRLRDEAVPVAQPMLPQFHHHPTSTTLPVLPTQEFNTMERNGFLDNTSTHDLKKHFCVGPSTSSSNSISVCCNDRNSLVTGEASVKKIEVCMGGKCKKSGGAALLQEFQRVLGVEAAVVGCKCMGKCRDGPNVRVMNSVDDRNRIIDDSVRAPPNPLCIGVGLEDVDVIVANFFGEDKRLGLAPAS